MHGLPLRLLHRMLAGEEVTAADCDLLIGENAGKEGQYHDFKSGRLVESKSQRDRYGSAEVRQAVAGFANAEGGFLVLGVTETPRKVDGCVETVGSRGIDEWCQDVLRELAPYLNPPPRTQLVRHGGGLIVLVAVSPAPSLVPLREQGEQKYYRRHADRTEPMPDGLVADIAYGRKQHPALRFTTELIRTEKYDLPLHPPTRGYAVSLNFRFENCSLVDPCLVVVGVVAYTLGDSGSSVAECLRDHLDCEVPSPFSGLPWRLAHRRAEQPASPGRIEVLPFNTGRAFARSVMVVPYTPCDLELAAYILPMGSFPRWFQIRVTTRITGEHDLNNDLYSTDPVPLGRPRVGVRQLMV